MICTTIQNKSAEQILEALEQCEMAEIRLDRCDLSAKDMEDVFSSDVPLVDKKNPIFFVILSKV